jgi:hypothetical protein
MPESKNRTYESSLNAAPALRLKIQDPARRKDLRSRGEHSQSAHVDTIEIREDLLNRLIEAIKAI